MWLVGGAEGRNESSLDSGQSQEDSGTEQQDTGDAQTFLFQDGPAKAGSSG